MTTLAGSVTPRWLRLREPADAASRSRRLVTSLRGDLLAGSPLVVHDIGCGSGSMGRWLAPQLPVPQHWVLHDRDADLLETAVADPPRARDGAPVSVETLVGDLAELTPAALSGTSLVTASAVLDILTADEVAGLVGACVGARCPALLTLSVTGRVRLRPSDPLDTELGAAFNDHQRRMTDGRRLLGPDAPGTAIDLLVAAGAEVEQADSDWRMHAGCRPLLEEWLGGWVGAAAEHRPELASAGVAYLRRRRGQLEDGLLEVTVQHVDILARPGRGR